jgi:nucleoside-diphosphate-sugar epimerase
VGSHVVDALLARGQSVRALVRQPGQAKPLQERGVQVVVGDLLVPQTMATIVKDAGPVYHCAAAVGPGHAKKAIYQTNLHALARLCEAIHEAKAGRLVLLSSVNVLGTRGLDRAAEDLPCRRSGDPAADVKIDAEQAARRLYQESKIDLTIIRPGFIYGPHDPHNLPALADAIRRGKLTFIGSRDNVVPLVHVRDVAEAVVRAGQAPAASGRAYHITDGSRTTIGQLADAIAEVLGCAPPQRVLPYWLPYLACLAFELRARLGPMLIRPPITRAQLRFLGTSRFIDITRARVELDYAPSIPWREGVAATLQWMAEHGVSHESQHAIQQPA